MKNLDTFSKRVLIISFSISMVLCAISLFLFSLTTISKAEAQSKPQKAEPPNINNYAFIGYTTKIERGDTVIYAVGINRYLDKGHRIWLFR